MQREIFYLISLLILTGAGRIGLSGASSPNYAYRAQRGCRMDITRKGRSMDWRHQSACRDEDPELFFPVGNTGPAITQIEEAKKVCNRCIVKDACLAWALESGQDAGVWGGLSEDERRALKRRAARNRARLLEQSSQIR